MILSVASTYHIGDNLLESVVSCTTLRLVSKNAIARVRIVSSVPEMGMSLSPKFMSPFLNPL